MTFEFWGYLEQLNLEKISQLHYTINNIQYSLFIFIWNRKIFYGFLNTYLTLLSAFVFYNANIWYVTHLLNNDIIKKIIKYK